VLAGSAGFVDEARRWRKVTGGGMRQAGVLAAAASLALDEGFGRLHEDHANAQALAARLDGIDGFTVRSGWTQSNMVWLDLDDDVGAALVEHARVQGVRLSARAHGARLVLHRDVATSDLPRIAGVLREFFEALPGTPAG